MGPHHLAIDWLLQIIASFKKITFKIIGCIFSYFFVAVFAVHFILFSRMLFLFVFFSKLKVESVSVAWLFFSPCFLRWTIHNIMWGLKRATAKMSVQICRMQFLLRCHFRPEESPMSQPEIRVHVRESEWFHEEQLSTLCPNEEDGNMAGLSYWELSM